MARFAAAAVAGLLAACSPVDVLNAMAPDVAVTSDIAYGAHPRQRLDVYAPARQPAPVVVFFYGGGWRSGDRAMYRFAAASLAAQGFVVVVPDYRLYPDVAFPAFIDDGAAAVAWTRAHAAAHGGDTGRMFVMGHSAGAYIAAMLTLDRHYLARHGIDPDSALSGMVGLAGPYDFLPLNDPALEAIFAPAGDLALSQPVTYARGDAPPLLLLHGATDTTVWARNTRNLAARIQADGGRVETRIYPSATHATIVGALARPIRFLVPVLRDSVAFMSPPPEAAR